MFFNKVVTMCTRLKLIILKKQSCIYCDGEGGGKAL